MINIFTTYGIPEWVGFLIAELILCGGIWVFILDIQAAHVAGRDQLARVNGLMCFIAIVCAAITLIGFMGAI